MKFNGTGRCIMVTRKVTIMDRMVANFKDLCDAMSRNKTKSKHSCRTNRIQIKNNQLFLSTLENHSATNF